MESISFAKSPLSSFILEGNSGFFAVSYFPMASNAVLTRLISASRRETSALLLVRKMSGIHSSSLIAPSFESISTTPRCISSWMKGVRLLFKPMTVSFRISTTAIFSHNLSDYRQNGFFLPLRCLLSNLRTSLLRFL